MKINYTVKDIPPEWKDYVVVHTVAENGHPIGTIGKIVGRQPHYEEASIVLSYYPPGHPDEGGQTYTHSNINLRQATLEEIEQYLKNEDQLRVHK